MGTARRIRSLYSKGTHPKYLKGNANERIVNELLDRKGLLGIEVKTIQNLELSDLKGGVVRDKEGVLRRRKVEEGVLRKYCLFGPQFKKPYIQNMSPVAGEYITPESAEVVVAEPWSTLGNHIHTEGLEEVVKGGKVKLEDIPVVSGTLAPTETYSLSRVATEDKRGFSIFLVKGPAGSNENTEYEYIINPDKTQIIGISEARDERGVEVGTP